MHHCDHALCRPLSVHPPSVVVNFSHFQLLLWNHWREFNETSQEAICQHPLPSLCFSGWLEKKDGRPDLWLAETLSTSPQKPLNKIQWNLTGSCSSKISTSSTMFVFFWSIGKTRWPLWPLIGSDIFDYSYETAERNSTKLDRKQDLNILFQVCVFPANCKNKIAALAFDWLSHFRLLLWNGWTIQWNLTGSKISTSSTKFVFFGPIGKQNGRPGLWLAETFSTSPLKPRNGIQRNLIGGKISTSSTKFVFFWAIGKTRLPRWPPIGLDIFDISYKTPERNSTKLDKKQDLNVLYQGYVFWAIPKTKWLPWPLIRWDFFYFSSETAEQNSTKLWQKIRSQHLLPNLCYLGRSKKTRWLPWPLIGWNTFDFFSETTERFNETWQDAWTQGPVQKLCFSGRLGKQECRPGLWLAETFSTCPMTPRNTIQQNSIRRKISTSSTKFVFFLGQSEKQDGRPGFWLAQTFSTSPIKLLNGIQWNLLGSKI